MIGKEGLQNLPRNRLISKKRGLSIYNGKTNDGKKWKINSLRDKIEI